ncbi:MAG: hypothetical protein AN484_22820 [Aphanizomenon flos-aquae WA102]|jgi:phosphoserine phosphatase|uniref:Uncharacterized protein n=1 Tax=Aphanizomenon flos-aquae WA102 TaxID=1710896 RepID=A0A1B7WS65_APHFL|nr:MAG: hypothetical protein AN484_22820 [Aphanizomenon flos-aquae WA102]
METEEKQYYIENKMETKERQYYIENKMETEERQYGRVTVDDVSDTILLLKRLSNQHGISLDQTIAIAALLEQARSNDIAIATTIDQ